jgi:hypothetical protein
MADTAALGTTEATTPCRRFFVNERISSLNVGLFAHRNLQRCFQHRPDERIGRRDGAIKAPALPR